MNLEDLMRLCDGTDAHGMPKCSIVMTNEFWKQDGTKELVNDMILESPTVHFFNGDGYTQVDLDFGSKYSIDLGLAYDALCQFRTLENSMDELVERIPVTSFAILPSDCEEKYYLACINPLWVGLTAQNPLEDLHIIRMTFEEKSVLMFSNQDIDFKLDTSVLDGTNEEN